MDDRDELLNRAMEFGIWRRAAVHAFTPLATCHVNVCVRKDAAGLSRSRPASSEQLCALLAASAEG